MILVLVPLPSETGMISLAGEVSFVFAPGVGFVLAPGACPERFPSFLNMSASTVLLHPAS